MFGALIAASMADENGSGKLPLWFKVAREFGFPTLLAAGLLWWVLGNLDARLNGMAVQQEFLIRLTQQLCVNTAQTAEQRNACWNPWK